MWLPPRQCRRRCRFVAADATRSIRTHAQRAAVADYRRTHHVTEALLPVPPDHVTACATDWAYGGALTVHPLTVAYWTRA